MSETVHYKGKLKEVEKLENEKLDDLCKRYLNNKPLPSCFESYIELIEDELYKNIVIHNEKLYEVVEMNEIHYDEDIFIMNDDLSFEVRYYNGGCSFHEAIEEAFDLIKEGNQC